jgi:hypothetical protein
VRDGAHAANATTAAISRRENFMASS